jgi:hypothetical protein
LYIKHSRLGGYIVGVPPLPIPNREVKPYKADGTAVKGGRVSRRHNIFVETHQEKAFQEIERLFCFGGRGVPIAIGSRRHFIFIV